MSLWKNFPPRSPHFPNKTVSEACQSHTHTWGFPSSFSWLDVGCNHQSRAVCAAGTEKPAHWASRCVTDFLGRWCYLSVACITVCFHMQVEKCFWALPGQLHLSIDWWGHAKSPVEPHWQPERQSNAPLGRREEEPETLSQGHCRSSFHQQEKNGAPEWDTTSWVSTNFLILTQPKTLINTFFWLQNLFPPTQVWHRSLRSSDLTSNCLMINKHQDHQMQHGFCAFASATHWNVNREHKKRTRICWHSKGCLPTYSSALNTSPRKSAKISNYGDIPKHLLPWYRPGVT